LNPPPPPPSIACTDVYQSSSCRFSYSSHPRPFVFLLALGALAVFILYLVDVEASRRECRAYLVSEAARVYDIHGGEEIVVGLSGERDAMMDGVVPVALAPEDDIKVKDA
jgi:hypothetical protein